MFDKVGDKKIGGASTVSILISALRGISRYLLDEADHKHATIHNMITHCFHTFKEGWRRTDGDWRDCKARVELTAKLN